MEEEVKDQDRRHGRRKGKRRSKDNGQEDVGNRGGVQRRQGGGCWEGAG